MLIATYNGHMVVVEKMFSTCTDTKLSAKLIPLSPHEVPRLSRDNLAGKSALLIGRSSRRSSSDWKDSSSSIVSAAMWLMPFLRLLKIFEDLSWWEENIERRLAVESTENLLLDTDDL